MISTLKNLKTELTKELETLKKNKKVLKKNNRLLTKKQKKTMII